MLGSEFEHYCHDVDHFPIEKFLQQGTGRGRSVLIVGESPAKNGWRLSKRAFYTLDHRPIPSGKNLNELLVRCGLNIDICSFTELVKCYIGNDRMQFWECGDRCWNIFEKQLNANDFRIILTLGVRTLALINKKLNSSFQVGTISEAQLAGRQYQLVPIYHPSPVNPHNHQRNLDLFKKFSRNLKALLRQNDFR